MRSADVVLLMNCMHSELEKTKLNTTPNMGLEFLKEYLNYNGVKTEILYLDFKNEKWIYDYKPKLFGIHGVVNYLKEVKDWAKVIKRDFDDVKVIVGGPVSFMHEELLKSKNVDAVCFGEGEITLLDYACKVINNESTLNVSGIYQRGGDFSPRVEKVDLEGLILPDYKGIRLNGEARVITSRGCSGKCSFCDMKKFYPYLRLMSADKTINWINKIKANQKIKKVSFHDDNFLVDSGRVEKILNYLEKNGLSANFLSRADSIIKNEKLLKQYAGIIKSVQLGIESFSQSQLDRWCKGLKVIDNFRALEILNSLDIEAISFIILNDKNTTIEELDEQIEGMVKAPLSMVHDMRLPFIVTNYDYNSMMLTDGTIEAKNIEYFEIPFDFLKRNDDKLSLLKDLTLACSPSRPEIKELINCVNSYANNRLYFYKKGVKALKEGIKEEIAEWEEDVKDYESRLNNYISEWKKSNNKNFNILIEKRKTKTVLDMVQRHKK